MSVTHINAEAGRVYLMAGGEHRRVLKVRAAYVEFESVGPYPVWAACGRSSFERMIESVIE